MKTQMLNPEVSNALGEFFLQRYGDGQLYFEYDRDRELFDLAVDLGYASEDGCLTAAGKRLSLSMT